MNEREAKFQTSAEKGEDPRPSARAVISHHLAGTEPYKQAAQVVESLHAHGWVIRDQRDEVVDLQPQTLEVSAPEPNHEDLFPEQAVRAGALRVAREVLEAKGKSGFGAPGERHLGNVADLLRVAEYIAIGDLNPVVRSESGVAFPLDQEPTDPDGARWSPGDDLPE